MHYKCCRECRTSYRVGLFEDFGTCDPRSYICKMCAGAMADLPEGHPLWTAAARMAELELQRCLPVEWRSSNGAD